VVAGLGLAGRVAVGRSSRGRDSMYDWLCRGSPPPAAPPSVLLAPSGARRFLTSAGCPTPRTRRNAAHLRAIPAHTGFTRGQHLDHPERALVVTVVAVVGVRSHHSHGAVLMTLSIIVVALHQVLIGMTMMIQ